MLDCLLPDARLLFRLFLPAAGRRCQLAFAGSASSSASFTAGSPVASLLHFTPIACCQTVSLRSLVDRLFSRGHFFADKGGTAD